MFKFVGVDVFFSFVQIEWVIKAYLERHECWTKLQIFISKMQGFMIGRGMSKWEMCITALGKTEGGLMIHIVL